MPRPDFRGTAARRLAEERELSPAIISLLGPAGPRAKGVKLLSLDRIEANPDQPRMTFDEEALKELAASIREHGVLQPVLVRETAQGRYQLIAGERRWRASRIAGVREIPAMIEDIDDDTALEIAIIENLQREDLSPLDEAVLYERMTKEHGYSVRKLAQKIGQDKGYIENRLRLADAPPEIKSLVSLRKDTLSHAYELLKVDDPRKRARLADQVAKGELTLIRLRDRIEGRRGRDDSDDDERGTNEEEAAMERGTRNDGRASAAEGRRGARSRATAAATAAAAAALGDDALVNAKDRFSDALEELLRVLRTEAATEISEVDRANLAKYLTISKLKLENAIALVRPAETIRGRRPTS